MRFNTALIGVEVCRGKVPVYANMPEVRSAQETFEHWTDERIDGLLFDVAKALAGSAKELAIATVRETGMGDAADKTRKNRFASLRIYASLAGKIAQGPLSFGADRQDLPGQG